jgi:cytochrome c-type biogenesis protein CcmH/NrfG
MVSGRLDEAIHQFRQAISLSPSNGYAYGGLGNALLGIGHLAEAQAALEHCLDLLPRDDPWHQQYVDQLRRCRAMLGGTSSPQPATAPSSKQ